MFPGNDLVVETIMEKDAKRRYNDIVPMIQALSNINENILQNIIGEFYDEFAEDRSFIQTYGLYIPTVRDDLMDQSIRISADVFISLSTSLTKKEYTELILEQIAPGHWSRGIVYKVMEFELKGLMIMRTHMEWMQKKLGVDYGPII
jgi:hypothetical protein